MKKVLPVKFSTTAFVITLLSLGTMQCLALCPIDKPCPNNSASNQGICKNQCLVNTQEKLREEKKAEYESRLNLTSKQQAKLEKIKAEEHKELTPVKEEIQKTHDKLQELLTKEQEIRKNSIKKFESILDKKQKVELEKIKEEVQQELNQIPEEIK